MRSSDRMPSLERVAGLFRAFAEGNSAAFHRAAEGIIMDELTANRHSAAKMLQEALDQPGGQARRQALSVLPRDRKTGDSLLLVREPRIQEHEVILSGEASKKLERVVEERRQAAKLRSFGLAPKSKLLFWGPPGCGKTATAEWLAGRLGVRFGVVRLSSIVSSYIGETASHIQRVIDVALASPMVILIDEVDAFGKSRADVNEVGEIKRVVNSLLQTLETFQSDHSMVIAATNHQQLLDAALWRRFDDIVEFPVPSKDMAGAYLRRLLNGVVTEGGLADAGPSMAGLAFSEIERVVKNAIKSMVLTGMRTMPIELLREEMRSYKRDMRLSRGGERKRR